MLLGESDVVHPVEDPLEADTSLDARQRTAWAGVGASAEGKGQRAIGCISLASILTCGCIIGGHWLEGPAAHARAQDKKADKMGKMEKSEKMDKKDGKKDGKKGAKKSAKKGEGKKKMEDKK